ncbi:Hypothetical protein SFHH103_04939 (plasmid) [Sinorhizobium fredii HH103]|uniref:Uncharacterized protein n=1 Tax=Sinorhizobium fredii (strain HH103) TaxID=1117943 RepID=G9AEC3_SINF1|nr:Hypothetical protein SFHH103_04939 [Sinorhizobium fredii HH103]
MSFMRPIYSLSPFPDQEYTPLPQGTTDRWTPHPARNGACFALRN